MTVIEEAYKDITDRAGGCFTNADRASVQKWLKRIYALGALDERRRNERTLVEISDLKQKVADQLREINTYRRIMSMHDLL